MGRLTDKISIPSMNPSLIPGGAAKGVFSTHWLRALLIAEIPVLAALFSIMTGRDPVIPIGAGILVGVIIYVLIRLGRVTVSPEHLKVGRKSIAWDKIIKVEEKKNQIGRNSVIWSGPSRHVITIEEEGEKKRISIPEVGNSKKLSEELAGRITHAALIASDFEKKLSREFGNGNAVDDNPQGR